jgi:hypothetical protein
MSGTFSRNGDRLGGSVECQGTGRRAVISETVMYALANLLQRRPTSACVGVGGKARRARRRSGRRCNGNRPRQVGAWWKIAGVQLTSRPLRRPTSAVGAGGRAARSGCAARRCCGEDRPRQVGASRLPAVSSHVSRRCCNGDRPRQVGADRRSCSGRRRAGSCD